MRGLDIFAELPDPLSDQVADAEATHNGDEAEADRLDGEAESEKRPELSLGSFPVLFPGE